MRLANGRPACPGCESTMSPFFAEGTPFAFCTFCGGAWIAGEALEDVARRALPWEPIEDGGTTRRCVTCALTLDPVLVGVTPVERCRLCSSVYLDPGELEELAQRRLRVGPIQPAPTRHELTFRCPGCGEEKPQALGTVTGRGYACIACAPSMESASSVLPPSRGVVLPGPMGSAPTELALEVGLDAIAYLLLG